MENIRDFLKNIEVFRRLEDAELDKLANSCTTLKVGAGETIFEEESFGKDYYMIVDGDVIISTRVFGEVAGEEPKETLLTTFGPGDGFGEVALIDREPRSATAKALTDVEMLVLSEDRLTQLVEMDAVVGSVVYKNIGLLLCSRLRSTNMSNKHRALWGPES